MRQCMCWSYIRTDMRVMLYIGDTWGGLGSRAVRALASAQRKEPLLPSEA